MKESYYFKAHQGDIIEGHVGEYVILKDSQVKGYYKALLDALKGAAGIGLLPGDFLVKKCNPIGTPPLQITNFDVKIVPAWKH
jgi:hypothetical protein